MFIDDIIVFIENFFTPPLARTSIDSTSNDGGTDNTNMGYVTLLNFIKQTYPERHSQYAEAYCAAAISNFPFEIQQFKNNWTLTRKQFVNAHISIIEWESKAGLLLHPMGPSGTGDSTPRWFNADKLPNAIKQLDKIPYTGEEEDDLKEVGDHWVRIAPPIFAGSTVAGWGYGLGQIDFISHWEWLRDNDWKDPYVNLDKSAAIFAHAINKFANLQNAVQAYNVGEGGNFKSEAAQNYLANIVDAANKMGVEIA